MWALILIGLIGGFITAISPCILPVLPVVSLAGAPTVGTEDPHTAEPTGETLSEPAGRILTVPSATKRARNRRPYAVMAGLVVSFSAFTLLGVTIVSALGLPDDVLRSIGLALLVLIGLSPLSPPVERLLERPFSRIPAHRVNREGGAFALGLGLGLLYVPCAGPVLAGVRHQGVRLHLRLTGPIMTTTTLRHAEPSPRPDRSMDDGEFEALLTTARPTARRQDFAAPSGAAEDRYAASARHAEFGASRH
ncbi:hypothetical protein ABZ318_29640 [Streptomyces sp. NPDC006197]|uniref:cytochrome c biogenesis CcdA family protein n=1 Tax=Streptomyces sp. NPDC006197 TaxID=3156685 RepID=UPI0033B89D02